MQNMVQAAMGADEWAHLTWAVEECEPEPSPQPSDTEAFGMLAARYPRHAQELVALQQAVAPPPPVEAKVLPGVALVGTSAHEGPMAFMALAAQETNAAVLDTTW